MFLFPLNIEIFRERPEHQPQGVELETHGCCYLTRKEVSKVCLLQPALSLLSRLKIGYCTQSRAVLRGDTQDE